MPRVGCSPQGWCGISNLYFQGKRCASPQSSALGELPSPRREPLLPPAGTALTLGHFRTSLRVSELAK